MRGLSPVSRKKKKEKKRKKGREEGRAIRDRFHLQLNLLLTRFRAGGGKRERKKKRREEKEGGKKKTGKRKRLGVFYLPVLLEMHTYFCSTGEGGKGGGRKGGDPYNSPLFFDSVLQLCTAPGKEGEKKEKKGKGKKKREGRGVSFLELDSSPFNFSKAKRKKKKERKRERGREKRESRTQEFAVHVRQGKKEGRRRGKKERRGREEREGGKTVSSENSRTTFSLPRAPSRHRRWISKVRRGRKKGRRGKEKGDLCTLYICVSRLPLPAPQRGGREGGEEEKRGKRETLLSPVLHGIVLLPREACS